MHNLIYFIEAYKFTKEEIINILKSQTQIKFISLSAVNLGNNHTDEKIVISKLIDNYDNFMKYGIQTDGSSVFLPLIADLNHAQVSLIPDKSVKWFVDYNYEHLDASGLPIGTLVIPSFIEHCGKEVCSRSILKRSKQFFEEEIVRLFNSNVELKKSIALPEGNHITKAGVTAATELEFWVNSPENRPDRRSILTSQQLKEQYWKRTIGKVRTALEKSILTLADFGLKPEMGHKEVGGVSAKLKASGSYDYIYEQLELDWEYDGIIQTADNEMFARDIVKDVFEREGLHVSFKAKPIEGAAGNGEHHHIGILLEDNQGNKINAFHPSNSSVDYLSAAGYASLMGLLKNYDIVSPFVSSSNNAFRRLVAGYEAPVSVVSSFGPAPLTPSRNRSMLVDLIREVHNPYACRFELRSPNPLSNTFLLLSAALLTMLDGLYYATNNNKTQEELRTEIMKKQGDEADYLLKDREYITDKDIFDYYTEEERESLYGRAPKSVYENLKVFNDNKGKWDILTKGGCFEGRLIASFKATIFSQWINELEHRLIKRLKLSLKTMVKKHKDDRELTINCKKAWDEIVRIKEKLLSDEGETALITQIENAIAQKDYEKVNELQLEIAKLRTEIEDYYSIYSVFI